MSPAAVAQPARPTVRDVIAGAHATLESAGIESPLLDAELLLGHAWDCDRTRLYTHANAELPARIEADFHTLLQRRLAREPIAYILGRREFWSLEFVVGPGSLVPRPETELLVERTLARATTMQQATDRCISTPLRICDVGTGSGCIAITLASELPGASVCATDVSAAALATAAHNARRHGVAARIDWVRTDVCRGLARRRFDIVVSNPPYVASDALAGLAPELAWEPRIALDGGADGLDVARRLAAEAAAVLRPGGWLLFEFGAGQDRAVQTLLATAAWSTVQISPDLAGNPRVVEAQRLGAMS